MSLARASARGGSRSAARRTLGCWLLAAFLERGCDSTTARVPAAVPRVRPLTAGELAERVGGWHNVRFLSRREVAVLGQESEDARVLWFDQRRRNMRE